MSTAAERPAVTPTNTADGRRAAPAEDERQAQVGDQQSDEEAEGALADSQFCRNCVYVCLGCQTELMLPKDAPANCQKLRCHECKLVHDAPEYHERRKQRRTGRGASEDVVPSRAKRRRTGDPRADCASDSPERDDYEVEAITCRRVRDDGQLEFYVRWVGYGRADDSWEPVEHLLPGASELVQEYERRREQYMESDLESDDEWEDRPHDDAKALDNETPREFAKRLGVDEGQCDVGIVRLSRASVGALYAVFCCVSRVRACVRACVMGNKEKKTKQVHLCDFEKTMKTRTSWKMATTVCHALGGHQ